MDKLFHGDIETVEIPEGGLELAPGIWLKWNELRHERAVAWGVPGEAMFPYYQKTPIFQSLRTLFLRQPSEDEE